MDCNEIKQIIPKYFNHTATEDEIRKVEEHLCVCHNCRTDLGELMDKTTEAKEPTDKTKVQPESIPKKAQKDTPDKKKPQAEPSKEELSEPKEEKKEEAPKGKDAESMEYFAGGDLESAFEKLKEPLADEKNKDDGAKASESEKEFEIIADEGKEEIKDDLLKDEPVKPIFGEELLKSESDEVQDESTSKIKPEDALSPDENIFVLDDDNNVIPESAKRDSEKENQELKKEDTPELPPDVDSSSQVEDKSQETSEDLNKDEPIKVDDRPDTLSLDALKAESDSDAGEEPKEEVFNGIKPDYVIEENPVEPKEPEKASEDKEKGVISGDIPQNLEAGKNEEIVKEPESVVQEPESVVQEPESVVQEPESVVEQPKEPNSSFDSGKKPAYSMDGIPIKKNETGTLEYICLSIGVIVLIVVIFLWIKG